MSFDTIRMVDAVDRLGKQVERAAVALEAIAFALGADAHFETGAPLVDGNSKETITQTVEKTGVSIRNEISELIRRRRT